MQLPGPPCSLQDAYLTSESAHQRQGLIQRQPLSGACTAVVDMHRPPGDSLALGMAMRRPYQRGIFLAAAAQRDQQLRPHRFDRVE